MGSGTLLRCAPRETFGFGATDGVPAGGVHTGESSSSLAPGSLLVAYIFLVAAGGSSFSLFSSRFFLSFLDCKNRGHLRRKRAGTRVGLHGGAEAAKVPGEGGSEDDIGDSIGSVDDVREDGLGGAEEETVDSRAVVVEEVAPDASSGGLFSMRKRNRGKSRLRATRLSVRWAAGNKVGFTEQSSDIAMLRNTQGKKRWRANYQNIADEAGSNYSRTV